MYRKNGFIITAAGVMALLANVVWDRYDQYAKAKEPPTNWFYVGNINIADGKAFDSKLPIIYDRTILRPFYGEWRAEIRQVKTQFTVCFGSSESYYEPKDTLPNAGVTLEWFMGRRCDLSPGQYYLEVNYKISPLNYPEKTYRAVSNLFTLNPAS